MAEISVFTVAPRKGDPPFTPHVHIWLSQPSDSIDGRIMLSPQLMTDGEIDASVNWLIKQLERVRKMAKKKLQNKKEQLRVSLQE